MNSFNCNEVPSDEKDPPMNSYDLLAFVLIMILSWGGLFKVASFFFPQLFQ